MILERGNIMKHRIFLAVISIVVVLFLVGGIFVLAGSADAGSADKVVESKPVLKSASSLVLSEDVASIDKEYYERKDAPSSKKITFEREEVVVSYDRSIIDDCGNVKDYYNAGRLNRYILDEKGEVIGFNRYYTDDVYAKLEDDKYAESVTEISTVEEAIAEAEMYLTEEKGIDLDNCELFLARYMEGLKVYYIMYTTKVGDFITEDTYLVDVAITGEIFSFNHKASPVPEEEAVIGYSYDDIEQRAIKDTANSLGSSYDGCTVKNIYAVSLDDGDYFKVVLDVYRTLGTSSVSTADSTELYYEIK